MNLNAPITEPENVSALAAELRSVLSRLKRRLREQDARGDLSPSQVAVVLRLEKGGPATASSLARTEGMRPQSMSAIVIALQEAGLIDTSADPSDGRQTLISLSKKCHRILREGRAARQDWLTRSIQGKLSAPEQQKLSAALKLLTRLTEPEEL